MNEVYTVKDGDKTVTVEVIEIEGKEFYTIEADYFENEVVAEAEHYYWNDEIGKWTKKIIDSTTTIF